MFEHNSVALKVYRIYLCFHASLGPCKPNPCKNDGVCEVISQTRRGDVFSEYVCKCQEGFDGVHCQNSKTSPKPSAEIPLWHLAL